MSAEKHFGKVLRSLRTTRGMSLRTLADIIVCSAVYVSEVERGSRPPFKRARIEATCKALALSRAKADDLKVLAARERVNDEDAETLIRWAVLHGMERALAEVRAAKTLNEAADAIEAEMGETRTPL